MIKIVNESIPLLNRLGKNAARTLAEKGIDVERLGEEGNEWQEYHFDSVNSTLRNYYKNGIIVYDIDSDYDKYYNCALSAFGSFIISPSVPKYDWKSFDRLPWKAICEVTNTFYCIIPSEENISDLKTLRTQRRDAKSGSVDRYNVDKGGVIGGDSKYRVRYPYGKFDKSGYEINPNKYKYMLAELNLSNVSGILQKAKKIYIDLVSKIDTIDFENDSGFWDYESIIRNMVSAFKNLDREYRKYNREKEEHPEWSHEWAESSVEREIRELQDIMREARKYLD